jgi:hypothetical protein
MPHQLIVPSSSVRFDFSNSNYNYDNTNSNVSSHLCDYRGVDPAYTAKNNNKERSTGTTREGDPLPSKA